MNSVWNCIFLKKTSRLLSDSGQGVLEYILVLTVTVSIIIGVFWQFSDAFRAWGNNYFGEYLACLLETGELPSVGGTGGAGGICNQFFEPFSLANGRPQKYPKGESPGGGSSGGSSGSGANKSISRRSGASTAGRVGGDSSMGANRFRVASSDTASGSGQGGLSSGKKESAYTGSTESSMPVGIYQNQNDSKRIKYRNFDQIGGFQIEKDPVTQREQKISITKKKDVGNAEKKRMVLKRNIATSKMEENDEGMGFGDFLRYLIIAAIILALVIFFGGQALQVGRSMD